jgi:hypothetical protein
VSQHLRLSDRHGRILSLDFRSFMNVISEFDHPLITKEWEILVTEKGKRTFELRLRYPWYHEAGNAQQKWILASCDQEFDEEGNLKSSMGCM